MVDNDDYEINIALNKKEEIISNEKAAFLLNKEVNDLKKEIEKLKLNYDKKLKKQEQEINLLKSKIKNISKEKLIIEPLNCNTNPFLLNKYKRINDGIDGGRGVNDLFEIFHLLKDKKVVYLAFKNKSENSQISYIDIMKIISINNYKTIKRLSGHNQRIVFIKYFFDPYSEKEYLVSGDREEKIIVWHIIDENNYERICLINTNYGRLLMQQSLYSALLLFTEKKNYIYTTTCTNNYSRLYELEDGGFIRDVSITYYNYTFYLIKYKNFIIDICRDYIVIYNPFNEEIYSRIEIDQTKGDNRSGCITYNKNYTDYLNISNQNGYIIIYDIKRRNINSIFPTSRDLYHIITWNLNYLIVTEYDRNYLGIFDLNSRIFKNHIEIDKYLICVKNIVLNEKEEIIFCAGENNSNIYILFSNNNIINNN